MNLERDTIQPITEGIIESYDQEIVLQKQKWQCHEDYFHTPEFSVGYAKEKEQNTYSIKRHQ